MLYMIDQGGRGTASAWRLGLPAEDVRVSSAGGAKHPARGTHAVIQTHIERS